MINLKLSGIIAATGFVLSLLTGVLSGGGFPFSLIRAFICGMIFFGLACGIRVLINRFLPELLLPPQAEEDPLFPVEEESGSRVDIFVDDNDDDIPAGAVTPEENSAGNDLDNISDLMATAGTPAAGMDHIEKESYTKGAGELFFGEEAAVDFVPASLPLPLENTIPGDKPGFESLPDLDVMAGAFMSPEDAGGEDAAPAAFSADGKPPGVKGKSMVGDHNSRELASAIQTILKKD
ncbi:hypothetical protein FACS189491_01500 [Spirochaetia bacterium]|nr:hypothetical protein FACS189491_01500 [Spirochaetia bacterium]